VLGGWYSRSGFKTVVFVRSGAVSRFALVVVTAGLLCLLPSANGFAATAGSSFTYQGVLSSGGLPANGVFDLEFGLFDAPVAGNQVGTTATQSAIPIADGLFTVPLDFGSAAFGGDARWLEIGVRVNGSGAAFTTLTPRQSLTPTPYAITALGGWSDTGNAGTVPATNFVGTTDNSPLAVRTNNVEALRVLPGNGSSGGNVGIGTTSPAFPLDVNGAINATGQYALGGVPILHTPGNGTNTFVGPFAGARNTTGSGNTGTGTAALGNTTTGVNNTAVGAGALQSNTTGLQNTAIGTGTLASNLIGQNNTAVGETALAASTGSGNTGVGALTLQQDTTGQFNTAVGVTSMSANTSGGSNSAFGVGALANNTTGVNNTAVGGGAGVGSANGNTTGSNNTFIGNGSGPGTATQVTNATALGFKASVSESNAVVLGGTGANAVNVGIGTQAPQSALQVAGNGNGYGAYVQIPIVSSASPPPAADCDTTTFAGRMVLEDNAGVITLWVCSASRGTWIAK
jgi:hypothetical protein